MATPRGLEAAVRRIAACAVALVSVAAIAAEPCGHFPSPGFGGPDMRRVKGRYANVQYFYSVDVPPELAAYTNPPPQPDHGFGIVLSWEPRAYLNVDATYDTLDWKTAAAAAKRSLAWTRETSTQVLSDRRSPAHLGPLHALRQVVRHRCAGLPDVHVDDDVVAVDAKEGVVFKVALTTTAARYRQDKAVMDRVLASWHLGQPDGSRGK